jgi:hypothetical protein
MQNSLYKKIFYMQNLFLQIFMFAWLYITLVKNFCNNFLRLEFGRAGNGGQKMEDSAAAGAAFGIHRGIHRQYSVTVRRQRALRAL